MSSTTCRGLTSALPALAPVHPPSLELSCDNFTECSLDPAALPCLKCSRAHPPPLETSPRGPAPADFSDFSSVPVECSLVSWHFCHTSNVVNLCRPQAFGPCPLPCPLPGMVFPHICHRALCVCQALFEVPHVCVCVFPSCPLDRWDDFGTKRLIVQGRIAVK